MRSAVAAPALPGAGEAGAEVSEAQSAICSGDLPATRRTRELTQTSLYLTERQKSAGPGHPGPFLRCEQGNVTEVTEFPESVGENCATSIQCASAHLQRRQFRPRDLRAPLRGSREVLPDWQLSYMRRFTLLCASHRNNPACPGLDEANRPPRTSALRAG